MDIHSGLSVTVFFFRLDLLNRVGGGAVGGGGLLGVASCSGGGLSLSEVGMVCSDHLLSAMACLWLSAFSRMSRFCVHILCGSNLPGGAGMRSLTGLPKINIAGDILVAGSGVFRYWRTARWKASEFNDPLAA